MPPQAEENTPPGIYPIRYYQYPLYLLRRAFEGIDKIIQTALAKIMGFGAEIKGSQDYKMGDVLKQILPIDLIKYGLIRVCRSCARDCNLAMAG